MVKLRVEPSFDQEWWRDHRLDVIEAIRTEMPMPDTMAEYLTTYLHKIYDEQELYAILLQESGFPRTKEGSILISRERLHIFSTNILDDKPSIRKAERAMAVAMLAVNTIIQRPDLGLNECMEICRTLMCIAAILLGPFLDRYFQQE